MPKFEFNLREAEEITARVEDQNRQDIFLTRTLLRLLSAKSAPLYLASRDGISSTLGIDDFLVNDELSFLVSEGLLKPRGNTGSGYAITQNGLNYVTHQNNMEFGYLSQTWLNLKPDERKNIILAVKDDFVFTYSKQFEFTLDQLMPLFVKVVSTQQFSDLDSSFELRDISGLPDAKFNPKILKFTKEYEQLYANKRESIIETASLEYSSVEDALSQTGVTISGSLKNLRDQHKQISYGTYPVNITASGRSGNVRLSTVFDIHQLFSKPLEYQRDCIDDANTMFAKITDFYFEKQKK